MVAWIVAVVRLGSFVSLKVGLVCLDGGVVVGMENLMCGRKVVGCTDDVVGLMYPPPLVES